MPCARTISMMDVHISMLLPRQVLAEEGEYAAPAVHGLFGPIEGPVPIEEAVAGAIVAVELVRLALPLEFGLVLLECDRKLFIHHEATTAAGFGFAAGTVGGGDQVDHLDAGCHLDGAEGDADAEGQVLDAERAGVDDLAEFATFRRCIGQAHVAQQDEELVAANAAEQVLGALRSSGQRVSKATVYNTLNLYEKDIAATYPRASITPTALLRLVDAYRAVGYAEDRRETCTYIRRFHPSTPGLDLACPAPADSTAAGT